VIRLLSIVLAIIATACAVQVHRAHGRSQAAGGEARLVPVASTAEVLEFIRRGKKVVFVNARESQGWQEEHIPGAINVSLRQVALLDRRMLQIVPLSAHVCNT
jgi:hypothetical protein